MVITVFLMRGIGTEVLCCSQKDEKEITLSLQGMKLARQEPKVSRPEKTRLSAKIKSFSRVLKRSAKYQLAWKCGNKKPKIETLEHNLMCKALASVFCSVHMVLLLSALQSQFCQVVSMRK